MQVCLTFFYLLPAKIFHHTNIWLSYVLLEIKVLSIFNVCGMSELHWLCVSNKNKFMFQESDTDRKKVDDFRKNSILQLLHMVKVVNLVWKIYYKYEKRLLFNNKIAPHWTKCINRKLLSQSLWMQSLFVNALIKWKLEFCLHPPRMQKGMYFCI